MADRHFQIRSRYDRRAKKARCACGWEGPWRSTLPTGRRWHDATERRHLTAADSQEHKQEVTDGTV